MLLFIFSNKFVAGCCKGICGNPSVMDIGGEAYLIPTPNMEKVTTVCIVSQLLSVRYISCAEHANAFTSFYSVVLCNNAKFSSVRHH